MDAASGANPVGETHNGVLRPYFSRRVMLQFRRSVGESVVHIDVR